MHPAEELERVAAVVRARGEGFTPDVYGTGNLVEAFEAEMAELLGKDAARFMPSGCMAQPIALRVASDRSGRKTVAFHPTSHLEIHEHHGYRELHGLSSTLIGDASRPIVAKDLAVLGEGEEAPACLLVELPAREIGGQLPSWDELVELCGAARARGIPHLHMDGARLWQVPAAYGKTLKEVCELFDSVYVVREKKGEKKYTH